MCMFCEQMLISKIGIVGYPLIPESRELLISLYSQILRDLTLLPESAGTLFIPLAGNRLISPLCIISPGYRQYTEAMAKSRLEVLQTESSADKLEQKLGYQLGN